MYFFWISPLDFHLELHLGYEDRQEDVHVSLYFRQNNDTFVILLKNYSFGSLLS